MPRLIKKNKLDRQRARGVIREDYAMNSDSLTDDEGNPIEDERISLYRDTRLDPGPLKKFANSLGISTLQSKTMIPAEHYKHDLVGSQHSFNIARNEGESLRDYNRRVNEDYVDDFMGGYNIKEGSTIYGAPKTVLKNKKTGDRIVIKESRGGDSILKISSNAAREAEARREAERLNKIRSEQRR